MKEKPLHKKTISELKNECLSCEGYDTPEYLETIREWAIAIAKTLPKHHIVRRFLIYRFEIKESELK